MTDIIHVHDSLKHDLLAMFVLRYGQEVVKKVVVLKEGEKHVPSGQVYELRIPLDEHLALPDAYGLNLSFDHATDELVLSLVPAAPQSTLNA